MQIVYFPFLSMSDREEVDFGFLKVWNYDRMSSNYITGSDLLNRVSKIMETNHAYFSGPLRGIGIVSIGDTDFREYNQDENELTKIARLILYLCFLSKNNAIRIGANAGLWCATTENFNLVFQKFSTDVEHMALHDGYIIQISDGGYLMGKDIFYRPSYVPTPFRFEIDEDLFNSLLILRQKKPRVFKRIIRSTELFSESYYNSSSVSNNARIL
ncbi:hypothetical protein ACFLTP_03220 [Chloroflexota bacterium]